jgi:hypothetical protein
METNVEKGLKNPRFMSCFQASPDPSIAEHLSYWCSYVKKEKTKSMLNQYELTKYSFESAELTFSKKDEWVESYPHISFCGLELASS